MQSSQGKDHSHGHARLGEGRGKWIFLAFAAIAAFFLFTEHRAHLFGILPYLLLLACPLMHFFHHGGHGGGHDNRGDEVRDKTEGEKK